MSTKSGVFHHHEKTNNTSSLAKQIFNRFMQNIATEYEMLLKSPCQNSERES
jgi:hypothetical protein